MAISKIEVTVKTSSTSSPAASGKIFVAVRGREFRLNGGDQLPNPFEPGRVTTFKLGENSNILNASGNDPRDPELDIDTEYPAYLRFEPAQANSKWTIDSASIRVYVGVNAQRIYEAKFIGSGSGKKICLSNGFGKLIYLDRER